VLHSAGSSIIQNAANHGPFLRNWHFDYGPLRFDWSVGKDSKLQARLLPVFFATAAVVSKNARLDLHATVLSGFAVYKSKTRVIVDRGRLFYGQARQRAFVYADISRPEQVMAHEFLHLLQAREYQFMNAYLNFIPRRESARDLQKIGKYIYPDLPWQSLFYIAEGGVRSNLRYYRNFFEFEAERFSTNRHVIVR
jgi:hypothetical protein